MVGGADFFARRARRSPSSTSATQGSRPGGLVVQAVRARRRARARRPARQPVPRAPPPSPSTRAGTPRSRGEVSNYGEGSAGIVDLQEATVKSYNTVFAQLIIQVEPKPAMDVASRLGIRSPLQAGARRGPRHQRRHDRSTWQDAYQGTFANRGVHNPPVLVTRIAHRRRHRAVRARPGPHPRALPSRSPTTVAPRAPPGRRARGRAHGRRSAGRSPGKTGTAQLWRDAWFAGYTPDLVAAVCGSASPASRSPCSRRARRIPRDRRLVPAQVWQRFHEQHGARQAPRCATSRRPDAATPAPERPTATAAAPTTDDGRPRPAPPPASRSRCPTFHGQFASDADGRPPSAPGSSSAASAPPTSSVDTGRVAAQWPPPRDHERYATSGASRCSSTSPRTQSSGSCPTCSASAATTPTGILQHAGFDVDVVERSDPATAHRPPPVGAASSGGRRPIGGRGRPGGARPLTIWVNP